MARLHTVLEALTPVSERGLAPFTDLEQMHAWEERKRKSVLTGTSHTQVLHTVTHVIACNLPVSYCFIL